jgi:hypothetical protein
VGRGLGVALGVAVGVGVGDGGIVAVGVAEGVGVGVGDAGGVTVGVGVGVTGGGVGVGVPGAHGVTVAVGVGVGGGGVGGGVPTAVAILTRPQPYTLFGGPAGPHSVLEIKTVELSKASRLAWIWFCKLGMADHNKAMAPAICGVAMDVPLAVVYEASPALLAERVLVPGAVISGFVRLLPSLVTGPRLLKLAIVSVPVFKAPTV